MKILYVATQDNPLDINAGSGADYEVYRAFVTQGAEVRIIGPFADRPSLIEQAYRKAHGLFSNRRFAKHSVVFLRQIAKSVREAISLQQPDIVFSINTVGLAYCPASVPLVCRLDTSLKGHQEQFPIFSQVEYRRMMAWEQKTLRKVSLVFTYSEWNANILSSFYRVPRTKVLVVPVPASLPEEVVPRRLAIERREMLPLHLLLVGRNYNRKGVDIALEVADLLNRDGVPVELRIVGLDGKSTSLVQYLGLFRKSVEAQLHAYVEQFRWAHFLLHPARFEAGGISVSEAAAFGLPAVTNAAGGLATTVKDGVSGIVLPAASPAEAYVAAIKPFLEDPAAYQALCQSTRQRYEDELNWTVTGKKLFQALQEIVDARRGNPVVFPAQT